MERILVAKDGTQENLLKAISDVAKAGVMAKTAKDAEIPMEGLYKTLQPNGNLLLNGSVQILGKKLLIGGEGKTFRKQARNSAFSIAKDAFSRHIPHCAENKVHVKFEV